MKLAFPTLFSVYRTGREILKWGRFYEMVCGLHERRNAHAQPQGLEMSNYLGLPS